MKVLYRYSFLLIVITRSIIGLAQDKRASHWYFGWEAGIDFSSGLAVADTNGKIFPIEGSSSISDAYGNLLFYSGGDNVRNRNHALMPNGAGLFGNPSSVESCLIVPLPGDTLKYYIFTTGNDGSGLGSWLFSYSIVDMSLDGGLGDVVPGSKNTLLFNESGEDLAGTMHCDDENYWIIARKRISETDYRLYSYLLHAGGLAGPVITTFYGTNFEPGHLAFSQDGSILSSSVQRNINYILDFDRQNGTMTPRDTLTLLPTHIFYSSAFSPDNSKLYCSSWELAESGPNTNNFVSQFDLSAANIMSSRFDLDSVDFSFGSPNGYGFLGRLQLAPDQRIYSSRWNQNHPYTVHPDTYYSMDSIDGIKFPNLAGSACAYQRNILYLNKKPAMIGLPNFISQFTSPVTIPQTCESDGILDPDKQEKFCALANLLLNQLQVETQGRFELVLYNNSGTAVMRTEGHDQTLINIEHLSNGLYLYIIRYDDSSFCRGKIIKINF